MNLVTPNSKKNSFFGWILGLVLFALVVTGIFWTIFYTPQFANLPFIIRLRNLYQNGAIQIVKKSNDTFTYQLIGSNMGIENSEITLRGGDNKKYIFVIPAGLFAEYDLDVMMLLDPSSIGNKVKIEWEDTRPLNQIDNEYQKNPLAPVNSQSKGIFSISKL